MNIQVLAEAICKAVPDLAQLSPLDIEDLITSVDVDRFERRADYIRARYGHTVPVALDHLPTQPPSLLYHGTTFENAMNIRLTGLVPMRRHYVHLASHIPYTTPIRRKAGRLGVLLAVHAQRAHQAGTEFWQASSVIWLAHAIHVCHISIAVTDGKDNHPESPVLIPLSEDHPLERAPMDDAIRRILNGDT